MVYKRFRISCICRVLLLTLNIALFFYLYFQTDLYFTTLIFGILPVIQVIALLNYIDKTNQWLTRTFESIRYEDFSDRINTRIRDASFGELGDALNRIMDIFLQNRLEEEHQFQYLQAIIHQAGMGLISVMPDGTVNLANKAARSVFGISPFGHICQMDEQNKGVSDRLLQLKSGDRTHVTVRHRGEPLHLSVYSRDIRLHGEKYRLLTFQNIQDELEDMETDAWRNLIRVLSHEIMNSMTPIASLATTANALVSCDELEPSDMDDIRQAVGTIEKRSRGLMQFVRNYRQFSKIPAPDFQIVPVTGLFDRIESLIRTRLQEASVKLTVSVEPDTLLVKADPNLMEQVLLNLVANAFEALGEADGPEIRLTGEVNDASQVIIRVSDNGKGIDADVLPKIFIPFFTTRYEGSGIGLSLSRQIMRLHGGNIRVVSEVGGGTSVSLIF